MPVNVCPKRKWAPTDQTAGNRRDVGSVPAKCQAEAEAALNSGRPWVHSDRSEPNLVPFLQLAEEKPQLFPVCLPLQAPYNSGNGEEGAMIRLLFKNESVSFFTSG